MARPKKVVDNTKTPTSSQEKIVEIVEIVKEVIKYVPQEVFIEKPRLEDFELYNRLKEIGYPQGGGGSYLENPMNIDKVYVPTAQEVIAFFIGDPDKWEHMRDGIIRTYIEVYESYGTEY